MLPITVKASTIKIIYFIQRKQKQRWKRRSILLQNLFQVACWIYGITRDVRYPASISLSFSLYIYISIYLSFSLPSVRLNKLATLMSVNVADLADTSLLLWSLYHGVRPVYCSPSAAAAAADVRTIFSSRRRSITRPSKYFLTRVTKKILRA